jgi:BirA family biotin operon repressor/biotin-[acetyl-CoA-carboxylase] ligase
MMKSTAFQVLRHLADGAVHSGQAIAADLGLTRSAVWYAIQDIEVAGFVLTKVRGRGYGLSEPLSLLDQPRLQGFFANSALDLSVCEVVGSTNTELLARAAVGAPSGSVLAAELQTAGRGRSGRVWHSRVGDALTFSVLWRFTQGARELAGLSLAVGLALARAFTRMGAPVQLKWPNDVVVGPAKLAGILIEMQGDMLGPSAVVMGIGINVRGASAVQALVDQPIMDLQTLTGQIVDRNDLLVVVLQELETVLMTFSQIGFSGLQHEWQARHAYQDQTVVLTLPDGQRLEGVARGVAEDGVLLLETAQGIRRFHSAEVSLRGLV